MQRLSYAAAKLRRRSEMKKEQAEKWEKLAEGLLLGRTLERIEWKWFDDGAGEVSSAPVLHFSGGVIVTPWAQETDTKTGILFTVVETAKSPLEYLACFPGSGDIGKRTI